MRHNSCVHHTSILMGDLYSEWLVKRKTPAYAFPVKILIFAAMMVALTLAILTFQVLIFIAAIAIGVGFYFFSSSVNLEFEYIYVNGEFDIDKIINQAKRKRALTFDMNHLEIIAPEGSHHLDGYNNKTCKTFDFSSGDKESTGRYIMYGTVKNEMLRVILEPNDRILNDMRMSSPRKVIL